MASELGRLVKRFAFAVLAVVALVFAVQGGEFGTLDLVTQWRSKAQLVRSIDSLRHVVDSLRRYEDAVQHDPATQERIAREVFGMVRGDKELVYRFADSSSRSARP